jgi:nitronate monooxygenase
MSRVLDELAVPVVLAPLAGGPSTPELTAAVSNAGGLGFMAIGYLSAEAASERIEATRALTDAPFGVNVFAPGGGPADAAAYASYLDALRAWSDARGLPLGEPAYSDDAFTEKVGALIARPVAVVSFTFGCPAAEVIAQLQAAGSECWVTVTTPDEAREAVERGADALVVQGAEAGGHRGSFSDHPDLPSYGLLALLQLVGAVTDRPLVASGGLMNGGALAAALVAGARAGQFGTAFMLAPEAGTNAAHREMLRSSRETVLTRAFTGRQARGIRNAFIEEHEPRAPVAYPELHYVTAPLRGRGREHGDAELINLWAGEAHELVRERPAGELVRILADEARAALQSARATL